MIRKISLWFMSLFYMMAGIRHFTSPGFYLQIMPPYLPWHLPLVYISGALEFLLGAALLAPQWRRNAAYGIIALLIAVFPANLYMYQVGGAGLEPRSAVLFWRLPLQAVLILWAYSLRNAIKLAPSVYLR